MKVMLEIIGEMPSLISNKRYSPSGKQPDCIALVIVGVISFCLVAFTGCGERTSGKQMVGVYENEAQPVKKTELPPPSPFENPAQASAEQARFDASQAQLNYYAKTLGTVRVEFSGSVLKMNAGGTETTAKYKVQDNLVLVDGVPLLYIADDNTLIFNGITLKRKQWTARVGIDLSNISPRQLLEKILPPSLMSNRSPVFRRSHRKETL